MGNVNTVFAMGGNPHRMIPEDVPPHPGHPTRTGTTVAWPSFVVVIHVLVVRLEVVIPSIENPVGGTVTVLVTGLIRAVVELVVMELTKGVLWLLGVEDSPVGIVTLALILVVGGMLDKV